MCKCKRRAVSARRVALFDWRRRISQISEAQEPSTLVRVNWPVLARKASQVVASLHSQPYQDRVSGNGPQQLQPLSPQAQQMSQKIMQMMSQLTEGQNRLTLAMETSFQQQARINHNVERSVEPREISDLTGIPQPDKFSASSGQWESWWYKFKAWIESCHKNAVKIIAQVESQCDKEITEAALELDFVDGAELVSAQARQALISLTKGDALEIVRNTSWGAHFGLEALRRLLCKYDPKNPQAIQYC